MSLTQAGRWPSPWPSLEIFCGRGLCALLMLWGLGGEADRELQPDNVTVVSDMA